MDPRVPLFRNQYRIPSSRWERWDYRNPGHYFVTICTEARDQCLGSVVNGQALASRYGEIVAREWLRIPGRFPRVLLDAWVVMPDHLHGILILNPVPPGTPAASLGEILGQFKSKSTRSIRAAGYPAFTWQERFDDRILRSIRHLEAVRAYIHQNPQRWQQKTRPSSP